jgi:two-component system nitrate/nitrite response regulator NarL
LEDSNLMSKNLWGNSPPVVGKESAPIRVVIFECTQMSGQLLARALEGSGPDLSVVGTAVSPVLEECTALKDADVAVISAELKTGPLAGYTLLRQLVKTHPAVHCVILLNQADRDLVVEAFRSGAVGVCERAESVEMLCKCVHSVRRGQIWANSQQLRYVLEALASGGFGRVMDVKGKLLLTPREEEVVSLVADGLKNREIAEQLNLSEHTVKNHLFRVFERLGISSRAELILYLMGQKNSLACVSKPV